MESLLCQIYIRALSKLAIYEYRVMQVHIHEIYDSIGPIEMIQNRRDHTRQRYYQLKQRI